MSIERLKQGIFKEELKNRFLCLVEIDGKDTLCYIPSSCRLSNFVDMAGKTVILLPVSSKQSRTEYSVLSLLIGKKQILLNMTKANAAIKHNLRSRRFAFLGERKTIKSECLVKDYKTDLFIEDTKTIVEIKSILSFEKEAIFPTVYSQRAIDQLIKISELLDSGYSAAYIFVSMNPCVRRVIVNTEIDKYIKLFRLCVAKGMKVKGVSLKLQGDEIAIHSSIDVAL